MYIICLVEVKSFRSYNTYIWYSCDYIDMDIKYYPIRDLSGNLVGYLNQGQINSNFTSMYYWNRVSRECNRLFNEIMDK